MFRAYRRKDFKNGKADVKAHSNFTKLFYSIYSWTETYQ